MNILYYDMGNYLSPDLLPALERAGHHVDILYYRFPDRFRDDFFRERFGERLRAGDYDRVLSVNFFPMVAEECAERGIPYVSWSYDSPLSEELEPYFGRGENRVYLFDRAEAERYRGMGFGNVGHLPLAVNVERLDGLRFPEGQTGRRADVSFVGSLYRSSLDALLIAADEYWKGYVEGLLKAQMLFSGCELLESAVTESTVDALNGSFRRFGQTRSALTRRGLIYSLARDITNLERTTLLSVLGGYYDVRAYTGDAGGLPEGIVRGPVKYRTQMPCVFRQSRLNLNPTLRSIRTGIPLRALDILGAGGVLFSNAQEELLEHFADGESVILYASLEEAVEKAAFYLGHGELLPAIAQKGREIVRRDFRYEDRVRVLMGA